MKVLFHFLFQLKKQIVTKTRHTNLNGLYKHQSNFICMLYKHVQHDRNAFYLSVRCLLIIKILSKRQGNENKFLLKSRLWTSCGSCMAAVPQVLITWEQRKDNTPSVRRPVHDQDPAPRFVICSEYLSP
jgi:hypothetical protein